MTDGDPLACSLEPGDLEHRLGEIAAIGAESLIARDIDGDRHLLRFRGSGETRRRLEAIVEAEEQCCSFLELSLTDDGDELLLSVAATDGAQPIADQLAGAFQASAS